MGKYKARCPVCKKDTEVEQIRTGENLYACVVCHVVSYQTARDADAE